jgi:chemotaxis protein histidine kinase CheA
LYAVVCLYDRQTKKYFFHLLFFQMSEASVFASPTGKTPSSSDAQGTGTPGGSSITGADTSLCGICFCEVDPVDNPRGVLNTCNHIFCFYCISTWAKDTNVCPHCKARFTRVTMTNADGSEPTVLKVRRKNYRGWEEDEGDEEEERSDVAAAIQASVPCAVCRSATNAARMLFCDRRTCHFVAHLECLGLGDAPPTYVCSSCSSGGGGVAPPSEEVADVRRDVTLADDLQREIHAEELAKRAQAQVRLVPAVAEVPIVSVQAVAVVSPTATSEAPNDVPYYLRGPHNAHAELAQQQLQSRLDSAAYQRQFKAQQKGAIRRGTIVATLEAPAAPVDRDWTEAPRPTVSGAATKCNDEVVEETPAQMEHRLTKMYFQDQLSVVRRRRFVERNQLRLVGEGSIAMRSTNRVEELSHEEAMRVEALHSAQQMAKARMESINRALRLREERALQHKAAREAHALAKLAEIVARHRMKELQTLRDRFRPRGDDNPAPAPASASPLLREPAVKDEVKVKKEPN